MKTGGKNMQVMAEVGFVTPFLSQSWRCSGSSCPRTSTALPLWSSEIQFGRNGDYKCFRNMSLVTKAGKPEHHLWMKRDSAGSGQKALNLVRIISKVPDEKDAVFGALDKWCAWETEFPSVAAAKALGILRRRNQWLHIIQVTMWLLSKGQCMTMGTYDMLLLAFDMEGRKDEAESIWNMILHKYTRSVPRRLFARMMSLYDHHHMPEKILEVFADMEELGVKPDEDTVRRVAKTLLSQGKEDKQKQVIRRYGMKWKYIHFNGERVRVRTTI